MKGLIKVIMFFTTVLFIVSCDDSVNPKIPFKENYALNCIFNLDTTYQIATVSRTFDVSGFDPNTNKDDPFISGAQIKIFYNDSVFVMKDTMRSRTDTSRYKTPIHFYYLNNFKPASNFPIRVEAKLPNGQTISAEADVYSLSRFYVGSNMKVLLPPAPYAVSGANELEFSWGEGYYNTVREDIYFSPELVILYTRESNGKIEEFEKKVALYFISGDRGDYPIYPHTNTRENNIFFKFENINRAMEELSDGDPQKSNYKIEGALFRLLVMDKNLAAYYAAQKTFLDEFSVRVNQPDFSNVSSGLGVVGSYSVQKIKLKIDPGYISSFGYKY